MSQQWDIQLAGDMYQTYKCYTAHPCPTPQHNAELVSLGLVAHHVPVFEHYYDSLEWVSKMAWSVELQSGATTQSQLAPLIRAKAYASCVTLNGVNAIALRMYLVKCGGVEPTVNHQELDLQTLALY